MKRKSNPILNKIDRFWSKHPSLTFGQVVMSLDLINSRLDNPIEVFTNRGNDLTENIIDIYLSEHKC